MTKKTRTVTLKDGSKIEVPRPNLLKDIEVISGICYIDHATGNSDHMNAHIRTERCKR